MKERILSLSLREAVEAFQGLKWRFYQVLEESVKVDVPRTAEETYVVVLPYGNAVERDAILDQLNRAGFVKETIRLVSEY